MRVTCVVGTRPNFIKMAALYRAMRGHSDVEPMLVHTGQHYDKNMSDVFFEELEIPRPDVSLGVAGGSHTAQTAEIMLRFESVLMEDPPDVVVVVGDVNSTLATGLVAAKSGVSLAHVEAGLRSRDRTMPEELNRIVVDQLSDFLFVTESSGLENLKAEGIPDEKVFFVGNVMIDTLMTHREKAARLTLLQDLGLQEGEYALVTLHRPANADDKDTLEDILRTLVEIAKERTVVFPIHPRTKAKIEQFGLTDLATSVEGFRMVEPMGYLDFLCAMSHAYAVLTDSGGIQEETTILGVPCLTMRNNTERPITIECGTNTLTGTGGDDILKAYRALASRRKQAKTMPPLWDGKAAERTVDILLQKVHQAGRT